jgi:hypothetical protein
VGHPLRQALAAVEAAAGKASADARLREQVQLGEEGRMRPGDVAAIVAAKKNGDFVLLKQRPMRDGSSR